MSRHLVAVLYVESPTVNFWGPEDREGLNSLALLISRSTKWSSIESEVPQQRLQTRNAPSAGIGPGGAYLDGKSTISEGGVFR